MNITYRCGHVETFTTTPDTAQCLMCGETRVSRVDVPPPTIRGHASGPHVTTERLEPVPVDLKGPNHAA